MGSFSCHRWQSSQAFSHSARYVVLNELIPDYEADLSQIIIVENVDLDPALEPSPSVQLFSKQATVGRYGLFPTASEKFPRAEPAWASAIKS